MITREELVDSLGGQAIQVQACIINTFADTGETYLNTGLGDLFLAREGFVHFSYARFMYPGGPGSAVSGMRAAGLLGFLIGGVTGAMAGSAQIRGDLKTAINAADDARAANFGLTLAERILTEPILAGRIPPWTARFFSKSEIKAIREGPDGAVVHVVTSGGEFCMAAPSPVRLREVLMRWIEGSVDEEPDCVQSSRDRPAVSKLLAAMQNRSLADVTGPGALLPLVSQDVYFAALLRTFGNLPSKQRDILRGAQGLPQSFVIVFRRHLALERDLLARRLQLVLLGELPGILGGIYLLINSHRDFKDMRAWGALSFLFLLITLALMPVTVGFGFGWRKRKKLCDLLNE